MPTSNLTLDAINALTPADHVANKAPQIEEQVAAKSEQIQQQVEAKSIPTAINIYDPQNNYFDTTETGDGDNPAPEYRASYDETNPDHTGMSYNAYETSYGPTNTPEQKARSEKRLLTQRKSLAKLLGRDWNNVTDEDVFAQGRIAAREARNFFQSGDGINKATLIGGDKTQDTDGRNIGADFVNEEGKSFLQHMNQPMFNSAFYSKYNRLGEEDYRLGSREVEEGKRISDRDATQSLGGQTKNIGLAVDDSFSNTATGVSNYFSTGIAETGAELLAGKADITGNDLDIDRRVLDKKANLTRQAQLQYDIDITTEKALNGLKGITDVPSTVRSVEDRVNSQFLNSLTPEELEFEMGTGLGTKIIGAKGRSNEGSNVRKLVAVEDDRKETLDTRRSITKKSNETIQKATTLAKAAVSLTPDIKDFVPMEERETNVSTGELIANKDTNSNKLQDDKAKNADLLRYHKEASTLWENGDYVKAAAKYVQGAGKSFITEPGATLLDIADSSGPMAIMIANPALGIGSAVNKNYTEIAEDFYKLNGTYGTKEQQGIRLAASIGSALLEKGGADVAVGAAGKAMKANLSKLLTKDFGMTVTQTSNIVAGMAVEGGEEVLEDLLKQVATNLGQDKLIDGDALYQSWIRGVAAGGGMKSLSEGTSIPKALLGDLSNAVKPRIQAAKDNVKSSLGLSNNSTPEEVQAVTQEVAQEIADTTKVDVGEVLAPVEEIPDVASYDFETGAVTPAEEGATEKITLTPQEQMISDVAEIDAVEAEQLDSAKGVTEYYQLIDKAKHALYQELQNITKNTKAEGANARLERVQQTSAILEQRLAIANRAAAKIEAEPISSVASTKDIGNLLVRGSAPGVEVSISDTLSPKLTQMVSRLSQFTEGVKGQVLGNTSNQDGKLGLAAHMRNFGAAIATDSRSSAIRSLKQITNFKNLQTAKVAAIQKGYKEWKALGSNKDVPVTVSYGNNQEYIVSGDDTQGFLNNVNEEVTKLTEAESLAKELGQAHFNGETTPSPTEGEGTSAEPSEAGDSTRESSSSTQEQTEPEVKRTYSEAKKLDQDLEQEAQVLEFDIAEAPTAKVQDDLIAEFDRITLARAELSKELDTLPKQAATEVTEEVANIVEPQPKEKSQAQIQVENAKAGIEGDTQPESKLASPIMASLINWSKGVKLIQSGKTYSDSLLKPMRNMLVDKVNARRLTGLLHLAPDIFDTLSGVQEGTFDKSDLRAIQAIKDFSEEFGKALTDSLPAISKAGQGIKNSISDGLPSLLDNIANLSPAYQFINANNEMAPAMRNAMAIATMDWVKNHGSETIERTNEDIYNFLGKDIDSNELSEAALAQFRYVGAHTATVEAQIGKAILTSMNLKQSTQGTLDPSYEGRLAQSLGNIALVALSNMQDPETSESRGYLAPTHYMSAAVVKFYTGTTVVEGKGKDLNKIKLSFTRLNNKVGSNGRPTKDQGKYVFDENLTNLVDFLKEDSAKYILKSIVGNTRVDGGVTALPGRELKANEDHYLTGSSSKMTDTIRKYINKLNSQPFVRNPQWDLMEATDKTDWLLMHGWIQPTVDKDTFEESFPEMHDAEAEAQIGKNRSIELAYEKMQQHLSDWEAGETEANQVKDMISNRLILLVGEGKEESKSEIKKLRKKLKTLDTEIQNYKDGRIYLNYHAISNMRVNDKTDTLSTQREKMHRNALTHEANIETIDLNNPLALYAVISGLLEPLGINPGEFRDTGVPGFQEKYLDAQGISADPDINNAIIAIQNQQAGSGFEAKDITKAVLKLKEGPHSLSALMVLASWSNALKEGKSSFVSHGYIEVDGTTNGVISGTVQLLGGFDPDNTNPVVGSKTYRIRKLLSSGGMFLRGTNEDYDDAIDYLRDNLDAYQNLAVMAADRLEPVIAEAANLTLNDIKKEIEVATNEYDLAKDQDLPYHYVQEKLENLNTTKAKYGVKAFGPTMAKFTLENGDVNPDMRKLMKSVVMPGGYQAGDYALMRSLFNAWLDGVYADMGKGNIDPINEVRASLGMSPISSENSKKSFSIPEVETLQRLYLQSIGLQVIQAYRESTGDFDTNVKLINSMAGIMAIISTKKTNDYFDFLSEGKQLGLSNSEKMEARKKLQKDRGIYTGFRPYGSADSSEGIAIVKNTKELIPEDRGGKVVTNFKENAIKANLVELDENDIPGKAKPYTPKSNTRWLKEDVPSSDVGVALGFYSIQNLDAATNSTAATTSELTTANQFDAYTGAFQESNAYTRHTNETYLNILRDYSIWTEVSDQFNHLVDNYLDETSKKEIRAFLNPKKNIHAPTYLNGNGEPTPFKNLDHFQTYVAREVVIGNEQRMAVLDNTDKVHQYVKADVESVHVIRTDEIKASSPTSLDPTTFDEANRVIATPSVVTNLFQRYQSRETGIQDSGTHKTRLATLMNNYIKPMLRETTQYGLNVDETTGNNTGGLFVRNTNTDVETIFIRSSDDSIRRFGSDMSDAEVLVHEFLHPIVEAGLANNSRSLSQLRALQQQAINSKDFTPASLVNPLDTDPVEALRKAEAIYGYVTGSLEEFMVYGLSNANVEQALRGIGVTPTNPQGVVSKMLRVLQDLIYRLMGRSSRPTDGSTVASEIDRLLKSFDTTAQTHMANEVGRIVSNNVTRKASKVIKDNIGDPLTQWAATKTYDVGSIASTGVQPTTVEIAIALAKSPIRVIDSGFQKAAKENIDLLVAGKLDAFNGLIRETVGDSNLYSQFSKILSQLNEKADTASLRASSTVKQRLKDSFTRTLKDVEQVLLTDTLLKGDLKAIKGLNANLIEDTIALDEEIQSVVSSLESKDKRWVVTQTQNLANVMVKGEATIRDGNLNAWNIARGVNHTKQRRQPTSINDEARIDRLKSLYAIKLFSVDQRNKLAALMKEQANGIAQMLEIDKVNAEDTLLYIHNNDNSAVVAGEVTSKNTNDTTATVVRREDIQEHLGKGYTLISNDGRFAIMSKRANKYDTYQKGVFSLGNHTLEGAVISLKAERAYRADPGTREYNNLLPIVKNGRTIAYRRIMNEAVRKEQVGDIGAFESIANHTGRNILLPKGASFNEQIIEMAHQDYIDSPGQENDFITIKANSSNRQVREFAKLMPREMRNRIAEEWNGKDLKLRKNHLDLLIGYRKLSMVDTVNNSLGNVDIQMSEAVLGNLKLAETLWQDAIGEVKKRTVLFTPAVFTANVLSNLAVSVLYGLNPVDMLRDQYEGYHALKAYTGWQEELADIELEIKLKNNLRENVLAKKRILDAMQRSGVHSMIEAGMYQTIVEDIDISAGESASPLAKTIKDVLPDGINNIVEDAYLSAHDSVKKGLGVVMLSPSTKIGASIQAATAYSDFVARYAMLKSLKKRGMDEDTAMQEIKDIYVDYAPNTSRELQYINDSGLYMYTKFLFRIQKVIMRSFANNPAGAIGLQAAQKLLGEIPDIADSSLIYGISLSGGRTQTPSEVLDMLTDLPGFHFLRGLKELMW